MQIAIDCSNAVDVLCRTLDQVRRLDLQLDSVAASTNRPEARIVLRFGSPATHLALALVDRIEQMRGVSAVFVEPAPVPAGATGATSHADRPL